MVAINDDAKLQMEWATQVVASVLNRQSDLRLLLKAKPIPKLTGAFAIILAWAQYEAISFVSPLDLEETRLEKLMQTMVDVGKTQITTREHTKEILEQLVPGVIARDDSKLLDITGLNASEVTLRIFWVLGLDKPIQTIFALIQKAADLGSPSAQYEIACMHLTGDMDDQSDDLTFKWFFKSASQGHPTSMYNVGVCYSVGRGVVRNPELALKWYEKAAKHDYVDSYKIVWQTYLLGNDGIPMDYVKAFPWVVKDAECGSDIAQYNLGVCYRQGKGTIRNAQLALKWFAKAAAKGHLTAQISLAECYGFGLGCLVDVPKADALYFAVLEEVMRNRDTIHIKYNNHVVIFVKNGKALVSTPPWTQPETQKRPLIDMDTHPKRTNTILTL